MKIFKAVSGVFVRMMLFCGTLFFCAEKVLAATKQPSFSTGMQNATASGLPSASLSDIISAFGGWMIAVAIVIGTTIFIRRR